MNFVVARLEFAIWPDEHGRVVNLLPGSLRVLDSDTAHHYPRLPAARCITERCAERRVVGVEGRWRFRPYDQVGMLRLSCRRTHTQSTQIGQRVLKVLVCPIRAVEHRDICLDQQCAAIRCKRHDWNPARGLQNNYCGRHNKSPATMSAKQEGGSKGRIHN